MHRDLKPENLFLTTDERIKILDFGLAKLRAYEPLNSTANTEPGGLRTDPGILLGTVGYMAPEQVQGLPADPRADIFSFGAILYELLQSRRAFDCPSAVETLSAILKEEPALDGTVPPALQRIVHRCLEKDPEQRFQSARDLAFALEALSAGSEEGLAALRAQPQQSTAAGLGLPRRRMLLGGAAAAVGLSLGAFALGRYTRKPAAASYPHFHQLTFRRGTVRSARFAPNGHDILYSALWEGEPESRLFTVGSDRPESRPLLDLPSATLSAVSSAGEMALLVSSGRGRRDLGGRTLARVPLGGGAPRELTRDIVSADWTPDGQKLAVARVVPKGQQIEHPMGQVLHTLPGRISLLRVSPDGSSVAFLHHPNRADTGGVVALIDKARGLRLLTRDWSHLTGLAWSPDGQEVWFSAALMGDLGILYAVPARGGSERVLTRTAGSLRLHDVTRSGRALVSGDRLQHCLHVLRRGDDKERELSWFDYSRAVALSADGKHVLFDEGGEGGGPGYSVYLRNLDGAPAVRLGDGMALDLSPDGRWALALQQQRPQRLLLWPTGAGEPLVLAQAGLIYQGRGKFLPDGQRVVFAAHAANEPARWYIQGLADAAPRPLLAPGIDVHAVSPDGRWLAAIENQPDGSLRAASLYPLDGGPPRPLPGLRPDESPLQLGADGRSVYVHSPSEKTGEPHAIHQIDLETGARQLWRTLQPSDSVGPSRINLIAVSRDGSAAAYSFRTQLSELYLVDGLS